MDRLLLIDDETDLHYSFQRLFASDDLEIATATSGEEGLRLLKRFKPDLVLLDIRLGGMNGLEVLRRIRMTDARLPVILMTAYGGTQTAIEAMKLGAYDYLLKPFDVPQLREVVARALRASRAMRQRVAVEPEVDAEDVELGLVGRSQAMQSVFKLVGQVAVSDATVLITGESGTGKELVARAIYQHSLRANQPFMAINCAAIPENLLESELFGHEKGAFTGATAQRIGRFEQCHRGTIFLDEIGDMPLATQTKILRVLQSGTFQRVGGGETLQVDVRVLAATNQDLERAVAERRFREDLYYRLNVVRITLPPLRERPEDIPLLAGFFLRQQARDPRHGAKSLSAEALEALQQYAWPGNVRELENAIRHAVVMARGDTILPEDLPREVLKGGKTPGGRDEAAKAAPAAADTGAKPAVAEAEPGRPGVAKPDETVAELGQRLFAWARAHPDLPVLPAVERELVRQALLATRGNQVQAARLLGITRATLRKRIERFGLRSEIRFE
ncbi:MAG: sigma-54-dependent Fis family transcriptional regulator [Verrucomicrobia bacterium]|nr:MAG: sigma-54-dependent Fis family transcriptional regulator [Verrucomicrobiota bacterium]